MDAYKAIITKRDSRSYTQEPIDEGVLRRILQGGRMAGSSKNRQPFRFVVVRDKEHMAELAKCGDFSQPLGPATAAIAVCLDPDGLDFDGGRAAQNIMLAAWNEGLGSCPVRIHHPDCGREVLGLPAGWRISMVVALGHPEPGVSLSAGRSRASFEEYVSWERFGRGES
ncbi:MAG TPA: nitroreductase family protein [Dehalococcoidia bacterium]|nr:nitroreductase family protein [Dehalococcoidia bacterium]